MAANYATNSKHPHLQFKIALTTRDEDSILKISIMPFIPLPSGYLIVIQAQSAQRLQISETQLFTLMDEVSLVANKQLVIVGPIFGGEALENLRKRLDVVGFVYFDDYFCIEPQHPDWCDFGICLRENSDAELKQ